MSIQRNWARLIVALSLSTGVGGCKALNTLLGKVDQKRKDNRQAANEKDNATRYAAEIEVFAKTPVDRTALQGGDWHPTANLLGEMDMKLRHIDVGVAEADAKPMIARLTAIKRRHAAEAAAILPDPEAALQLLAPHFPTASSTSEADAAMLDAARTGAAKRTEARAAMFREYHTYAWQGGKRTDCVFASQPFGAEGKENPGFAMAFAGTAKVHARCYLPRSIADYRQRPAAAFIVRWTGGQEGVPGLASRPGQDHHIDLEIDLARVQDRGSKPLAAEVLVELDFTAMEDNKMVVERGEVRVRPDAIVEQVTAATVFWER